MSSEPRRLDVRFVLVCEGRADRALRAPLEDLCIKEGADEVLGIVPELDLLPDPPGLAASDKVRAALELEPSCNLLFLHRDSDSPDSAERHDEILRAMKTVDDRPPYVAVVPVQATEAWLLADKQQILRSASSRLDEHALDLPGPDGVEEITDPKSKLRSSLLQASQTTGRRRKRFKKDFGRIRERLIETLDIDGPVAEVPSWQRLRQDLGSAMRELRRESPEVD